MAELNTVARPYTKAAFEYASDKGVLEQWSTMLETAASVAENEHMKAVLSNPALTASQKAEALIFVCEEQMDTAAKNFVSLLAENQRLTLIPEIYTQFEQLKANALKSIDVDVTTAFELDEQQQQKLAQALSSKLDCEVALTSTVDKTILGGIIVRSDDLVIDGSVRGRIAKLAEAMKA